MLIFPKHKDDRPLPLAEYQKTSASRNEAIVSAYAAGEYSYQQIADFFELHFTNVGKIIRAARSKKKAMILDLTLLPFDPITQNNLAFLFKFRTTNFRGIIVGKTAAILTLTSNQRVNLTVKRYAPIVATHLPSSYPYR